MKQYRSLVYLFVGLLFFFLNLLTPNNNLLQVAVVFSALTVICWVERMTEEVQEQKNEQKQKQNNNS